MNNLLALLMALLLAACSSADSSDTAQRPAASNALPKRVVCLAPSAAELLFALDAGGLVVGTAEHSDEPAEVRSLPCVGSYARPDLERVLVLRPNLCIAVQDGTPPQTLARLGELSIPVALMATGNLEELLGSMLVVGRAVGRQAKAEALVKGLRERMEAVRVRAAQAQRRPRVLFQVSGPHIMAAGPQSLLGQLVALAGGDSAAPAEPAYPQLSAEQVLAMAPEVVVAFDMLGQDQGMAGWPADPRIPAVRQRRLYTVDPALFARPGPRLAEALEALARIIHPEIFGAYRP
ncbi:MAG: helical backbone metal receptor [Humidesulfovibrio sp.]|uniref:ABC transporter substrate-binding protein n=1 Tax=Humidesulfovibrio sp. TaxID=2910988 RepID=UPI0027FB6C08|nr:helical backbone metal receptor [Humidesulfovibrio sp.]MDQ7835556.1 helical backbone metal receptor [Humidesulfovibrio sp.]